MAKPASFDDLPAWQREPRRLVSISDRAAIDRIPGATVALGAFLDVCRAHGATISQDGTHTVIMPLSEEELEQKLQQARRGWDTLRDLYEKWINEGKVPKYGSDLSVRKWAEQEGLKSPEEAFAEAEANADDAPAVIGDLDVIKDGF